jgi:hypothetical protein
MNNKTEPDVVIAAWAGTLWRLTPEDMMIKSKFGRGRDWPFDSSPHRGDTARQPVRLQF